MMQFSAQDFEAAQPGKIIVGNHVSDHHCLDPYVLDDLVDMGVKDRRTRALYINAALTTERLLGVMKV